MIDDIQYEVTDFIRHAKKNVGKSEPIPEALRTNLLNVSWKLIAGKSIGILYIESKTCAN